MAASFAASVAQALRERGHDPQAVAHFVNRLVFCSMFAAAVGLSACSSRRLIGRELERLVDSTVGGVAGPGNETRLYKTTARRLAASGPFREYYRGRRAPGCW